MRTKAPIWHLYDSHGEGMNQGMNQEMQQKQAAINNIEVATGNENRRMIRDDEIWRLPRIMAINQLTLLLQTATFNLWPATLIH